MILVAAISLVLGFLCHVRMSLVPFIAINAVMLFATLVFSTLHETGFMMTLFNSIMTLVGLQTGFVLGLIADRYAVFHLPKRRPFARHTSAPVDNRP